MIITKDTIVEAIRKVEEQEPPKEYYFRFAGIIGKGKSMDEAWNNWIEQFMKGGTK